ncbi:MAG TPA: class I SAM-dependent methyltransferase [Nocardioidaceae bacterium]|nr:class I SAM-dependent methyltransferase [Nocardioidaceae bacterium]
MSTSVTGSDADLALDKTKAAHRAMWALGDYPALAEKLVSGLGSTLVTACGVAAGDRVLDVAAGAGNAALPAARLGAHVIASDLTPELLAAGRRRAEQEGVDLEWRQADAEALPFEDDSFDVVFSCLGVMFAPHHQICADELIRVCRPGGTFGVISWTREGFIGEMFAAMRAYSPPPSPGAQSPLLWGDERHLRELWGDGVEAFAARRETVRVRSYAHPEDFRDDFKLHYGPTVAAYQRLAGDPQKTARLDADLAKLARDHGLGVDTTVMDWEFLLATGRKR